MSFLTQYDTAAVPDAIAQFSQRNENIANLDKSAQYFIKGMGGDDWLQQQGIDPTAVDNGSAMDRIGFVKGYMQSSMAKEQQQRVDAQTQDLQAQAQQRQQTTADSSAAQKVFATSYGTPPPVPGTGESDDDAAAENNGGESPYAGMPAQFTPEKFTQDFMAAGGSPVGALKYAQAFMALKDQNGTDTENPVTVDSTSLPNASIVKTRRGNQFQIVPKPADTTQDAQPVKDTDGNVLGYRVPTGNPKTPFAETSPEMADDTAPATADQRTEPAIHETSGGVKNVIRIDPTV